MMLDGSAIPRRITGAAMGNTIDEELLLLNVRTGRFHGLGGVALAVWEAIDGVRSLGDIQASIAARYDVDRATCFAEVAAFIDELRRAGLIDVD